MTAATRTTSKPTAEETPGGRFERTVAFITGASDGGIGGAIAKRLFAEGATVALASRQRPVRLLKSLSRDEARCAWWAMDVTSAAEVASVTEQCTARFGGLDVVVNNAGVEAAGRLDAMTEADWRSVIDVNLQGVISVTRAALAHLRQPGGVIVNIASALALGGSPHYSIYSASKAGLIGFTQSLAWELAPRGIRVVAVAPALVRTPMIQRHIGKLNAESLKQIEASHPFGIGNPQDVAAAVAFLASHEARWITGVTLPLGWTPQFTLPG
jgi:NAD(P)-dependent dehydrogenase (short-subunit alcohol dehydrogenase family)